MIRERNGGQLVELDGFLYALGGLCWQESVERYDPRTDLWELVASMNNGYFRFGSAVLDGRIYVVGACSCEVYDPQKNEWTEMPPPINKVVGRRLSVLNGKLFSTGGHFVDICGPATKTEYFDFQQNKWLPGKDMNVARAHHGVAVIPKTNFSTQ